MTTTATRFADDVRVALLLADLVVARALLLARLFRHLYLSMAPGLAEALRGGDFCENGTIDTILVPRADGMVLYRDNSCVWYGTRKEMSLVMQSCSAVGTFTHYISWLCVPSLCW